MKSFRTLLIYFLLIGGSLVFVWPFLWMAATSMKIDREMFSEQMKLMPSTPLPAMHSPYIDTRTFAAPHGAVQKALLAAMERHLSQMNYPWPGDVDHEAAIKQTARGLLKKLHDTVPDKFWKEPPDVMEADIWKRLDNQGIDEVVHQIYRSFAIGQLRARSYDLQEDQLVAPTQVSSIWNIGGNAGANLVEHADEKDPYAELHYDFSKGDTVTLSQTFTTTFPIARLHQLQFYYRSDDSWHPVVVYVEKLGVRYEATRTVDLGDIRWGIAIWQEPGPDDTSNKVRNWILLKEIGRGPQYESDPHKLKVTIELRKTGQVGAWLAKIRRSYRKTLDYIPFWRYVATSLFLVILTITGTMFSCSLVAYSFARLQWPGRSFCFLLMLATMMIPGQVTMIPYFAIIRTLGWYNTLLPLWVPSFFASAFNVFLIRQFMKGIPRDLEDAAKIDGCGFMRIYWSIMLPLIRPALATIAILTFMSTWNDFMGPLIYLSDQRLYPLSFGLYALNVDAGGDFGMMMAGSLLMTLPVIATFFFAQKYFLQGMTLTGMKG